MRQAHAHAVQPARMRLASDLHLVTYGARIILLGDRQDFLALGFAGDLAGQHQFAVAMRRAPQGRAAQERLSPERGGHIGDVGRNPRAGRSLHRDPAQPDARVMQAGFACIEFSQAVQCEPGHALPVSGWRAIGQLHTVFNRAIASMRTGIVQKVSANGTRGHMPHQDIVACTSLDGAPDIGGHRRRSAHPTLDHGHSAKDDPA